MGCVYLHMFSSHQLAPTDLQSSLLSGKNENGPDLSNSPVKVKRSLSTQQNGIWNNHFSHAQIFERITHITILGCIAFATIKLLGMNLSKNFAGSRWAFTKANNCTAWTADSSANYTKGPSYNRGSTIANKLKRILSMVKIQTLSRPAAGSRNDLHNGKMRWMKRKPLSDNGKQSKLKLWVLAMKDLVTGDLFC